jgi:hypothetical protein
MEAKAWELVVSTLLMVLIGLLTYVLKGLIGKLNLVGQKIDHLGDHLFILSARLHPEHAELIMKTAVAVRKGPTNGQYREQ